ncbi:DNA-binding response regulator, NarL/FixJ family, contains REC and HTH domains [Devosia lucknowensis]|uniref:DNA-binding response regulator, NarL/FixJ family, contains REC and HTH domains n=1 Tax=Devosia lucknowensis TaxID=1096929 RepID=A0A1Y6G8V7_9HYPH|nr:LuxR C-terminal-related transcriptional regulator [Devosia lucknowensis]SMQ86184.1 DNA-binding response regulator, NarL/FixJ family, contains REC and HTH domains [Devosia lucknowensis]
MLPFVDVILQRLPETESDAELEILLGDLAEQLGYRSAYLLDFPADATRPIRLWDSFAERAAWWRVQTENGTRSISRSFAEVLTRGAVQHIRIDREDPRYDVAVKYDFDNATVVPITFDAETRGAASFSGDPADLDEIAPSLRIVCYALLTQARLLGGTPVPTASLLTPRERQVMELSAEGLTSEGVANRLGMSARTVNQHLDNVSAKLGTRNRVHTVAEAIRRGLLG